MSARPKYQVFISSTYRDLHSEREAVTWEILTARQIPVGMENFTAANDRGWGIIARLLEQSDYYVLIVGGLYGSIDATTGISWTEREYDHAYEKKIPILVFIRERGAITVDKSEQDAERIGKLQAFIQKLESRHLVKRWGQVDDLRSKVAAALRAQIDEDEDGGTQRPGWYRGNEVPSPSVMEELARLSKENSELREKVGSQSSAKKQLWLGELSELKQSLKEGLRQARAIYPPYYTQERFGMVRSNELDEAVANLTMPDDELRGWLKEFVRITLDYATDWFKAGEHPEKPHEVVSRDVREKKFKEGQGLVYISSLEDLYSRISSRIDEILS